VKTSSGSRELVVAKTSTNAAQAIDIGKAAVCCLFWAGDDHLIFETKVLAKLGPGFTQSHAAQQGVVDPGRVCIVGSRWGGYEALAGVTIQQDLYRCAVSLDGVADPRSAISETKIATHDTNNVTRLLRDLVGAKSKGRGIKAISPLDNAARADAPVLLIYTKGDPDGSPAQSRRMATALRRASKPAQLLAITLGADDATNQASRVASLEAVASFVEKYDPPGPAGIP